jgi:hypothetical protein
MKKLGWVLGIILSPLYFGCSDSSNPCPNGELISGKCYSKNCTHQICPENFVCGSEDTCIETSCIGKDCVEGETCVEGECRETNACEGDITCANQHQVCVVDQSGTATCGACNVGWGNCDGDLVNGCEDAIPAITGTTPGSRCNVGTVVLGATASAGIIHWYAASTGGAALGTGTSFTTWPLSITTTFHVDATLGGCVTEPRIPVKATVSSPLVNNVHCESQCVSEGGEVVDSDTSQKQCRLISALCPDGWTRYKNFNAQTGAYGCAPNLCAGCEAGCCDGTKGVHCCTPAADWGNRADWNYNNIPHYGGCGTVYGESAPCCNGYEVPATITQVGCY